MLQKITGIKRQILISTCLYVGQTLSGLNSAWSGPIIPKLEDLKQSPLPYLLTETQISLVGSLIYLGSIPGPYILGWISNLKGRKPVLVTGGLFGILGYSILAICSNLGMLYSGRIFIGFSTGITNMMNIVYIGEMASTHIRGILLTIFGICNTVGSIIMFSIGPFISYTIACYVGLAITIAFTLGSLLLPETPVFYFIKGEEKNAVKVLTDLGRLEDIDKISEAMKHNLTTSTTKDWIELFKLKSNRRALFISTTLNVLQHSSGVLAVIFFAASIFEIAGSSIDFNIAMILIGLFRLSGSVISPLTVERIGRRIILMTSTLICSLSMFLLGTYFYLNYIGYSGVNYVKWLPFLILIMFFIGFDFGLGIIPNTVTGEMFTVNARSNGSAVALTIGWLSGFLITTAFGDIVENFGGHTAFWFFSCISAIGFVFTWIFVPETKGKSLMEIQELLVYFEIFAVTPLRFSLLPAQHSELPALVGSQLQT
ncbi:unnamed protein product, partial [Brenthis ino]